MQSPQSLAILKIVLYPGDQNGSMLINISIDRGGCMETAVGIQQVIGLAEVD